MRGYGNSEGGRWWAAGAQCGAVIAAVAHVKPHKSRESALVSLRPVLAIHGPRLHVHVPYLSTYPMSRPLLLLTKFGHKRDLEHSNVSNTYLVQVDRYALQTLMVSQVGPHHSQQPRHQKLHQTSPRTAAALHVRHRDAALHKKILIN